jgi:hypothetical protein
MHKTIQESPNGFLLSMILGDCTQIHHYLSVLVITEQQLTLGVKASMCFCVRLVYN